MYLLNILSNRTNKAIPFNLDDVEHANISGVEGLIKKMFYNNGANSEAIEDIIKKYEAAHKKLQNEGLGFTVATIFLAIKSQERFEVIKNISENLSMIKDENTIKIYNRAIYDLADHYLSYNSKTSLKNNSAVFREYLKKFVYDFKELDKDKEDPGLLKKASENKLITYILTKN